MAKISYNYIRVSFYCALLCFLALGCGHPKISGKVVFSDDQSPLTHGMVLFYGSHGVARGQIQGNGSFCVGSQNERDGLPPGEYTVVIRDTQERIMAEPVPYFVAVIDKKYENEDTSGLKLTVDRSQSFNIEVDRANASRKKPYKDSDIKKFKTKNMAKR